QEDLRLLRDGLYGKGPFARFATQFPAKVLVASAAGQVGGGEAQPAGWKSDPKCAIPSTKPYVFDLGDPSVLRQFTDILGKVGGELARQGIASVTIDMPHHGMGLPPGQEAIVRGALSGMCYAPLADAVMSGRAQDLNGDGVKDSGWWWWTPHLFHVRDNVRQG